MSELNKFYRVEYQQMGIYEAVEKYCPRGDQRRNNKPDGSWLPKVGKDYPGAKSYWTELGFKKYQDSGLMNWHYSVLPEREQIKIIKKNISQAFIYQDEYQVVVV